MAMKPLEEIKAKSNVRVIITFLEDEPEISVDKKTEAFLSLSGTSEDDRPTEEIIREIYESRTVGKEVKHGTNYIGDTRSLQS